MAVAVWLRELVQRLWPQCLPALSHSVQPGVGAAARLPHRLAAARAAGKVPAVVAVANPLLLAARLRVAAEAEPHLRLEQAVAVRVLVVRAVLLHWQEQVPVAQAKQPVAVVARQPAVAVQQPVAVLPVLRQEQRPAR